MIDLEKIKMLYKIGKGLSLRDVQGLIQLAKSKSYKPLEYIIEDGSKNNDVFYIKKGLVRVFAVNDKGDEITIGLKAEHEIIANIDFLFFEQSSRFYYQALEHTKVLSLKIDQLENIISKNPLLADNRKFILRKMLKESMTRVESFVLYSPEERYIKYVESKPDIVNRVPDKYIANVLGITPVSLSRIRKRIADRRKK